MPANLARPLTTTRLYEAPSSFQQLEADWKSLFEQHGGWNLFLSWEWFSQWWLAFGADKGLQILTLSDDGRLVAVAPMMVETASDGRPWLTLIGSDRTTDYGDILADPTYIPALCEALADFVADGFGRWAGVQLRNLPETSPLLGPFCEAARARGLSAQSSVGNTCPIVDLEPSWEGFLAKLSKTHRHELRRKIRRSKTAGEPSIHTFVSPSEVDSAVGSFFSLHRSSRPDKAVFLDDTMESFFGGVARLFAEAGWLILNFLRIDGRDVAATMSFSRGDRVLLYNSGLDPAYRAHSVGIALHAADIQQAIAQGKRKYDFLRGNEAYKYDLGGRDTPIYNLLLLPENQAVSEEWEVSL